MPWLPSMRIPRRQAELDLKRASQKGSRSLLFSSAPRSRAGELFPATHPLPVLLEGSCQQACSRCCVLGSVCPGQSARVCRLHSQPASTSLQDWATVTASFKFSREYSLPILLTRSPFCWHNYHSDSFALNSVLQPLLTGKNCVIIWPTSDICPDFHLG